jgi:hypothetical protein
MTDYGVANMKKIKWVISLLLFSQYHVFGDGLDTFPMADITIGMPSQALLEKYPAKEFLFESKTDDQILTGGIAIYEFTANTFWDALWIGIDNAKVESLTYLKDDGDDSAVKNVVPLFEQLKQQLVGAFEKKITYGETKKTRCAMYIWKREKDIVAFSHSPVIQYRKGDISFCQLNIAQKIEDMGALYENLATDSLPEDKLLWADAMGEEAVSLHSL